MKFLYPQFLWALLALAVPLIIHLFNFRRFTTLYFSDTRLLQNLVKQSRAINRLRHLLILLLRMLALAILVLAFANPYIPADEDLTADKRFLHVYVDNSPSMTSGELQTTKISEARSRAAEFIQALPSNYQVQVLSNDFNSRQMRFYAPAEAIRLIDEIEEGYTSRSLEEILNRIESTTTENKAEAGDIYLFSDFQSHAFKASDNLQTNRRINTVLPGVEGQPGNFAIDSVWFYQPVLQPGFDQVLRTRLSHTGKGDETEVALSLEINGETQGIQKLSLPPGGSAEAEFIIRTESSDNYAARLHIDAGNDPEFDNTLYFNFRVAEPFRILLTGSEDNRQTFENIFRDSIYQLNYVAEDAIDYGDLPSYDLIIADAPENPSSGFISALQLNLDEGKNLVILPSDENAAGASQLLNGLGRPGIIAKKEGMKAVSVSWDDPHFSQVFSGTPENPALPYCSYYYPYPANEGFPLIRLENGSPLVSRLPVAQGDVILFLSSLDSSGLKRQPMIVPLLLNAALFSRENQSLYTLAGSTLGPAFPAPESDQVLSVKTSGSEFIPRQRQKGNLTELYEVPPEISPGTYQVYDDERLVGLISLNTDPAESNWNFLTFDDLRNTMGGAESMVLNADGGAIEDFIRRRYEGVSLWKWFVAAALAMLLLELVLLKIWR